MDSEKQLAFAFGSDSDFKEVEKSITTRESKEASSEGTKMRAFAKAPAVPEQTSKRKSEQTITYLAHDETKSSQQRREKKAVKPMMPGETHLHSKQQLVREEISSKNSSETSLPHLTLEERKEIQKEQYGQQTKKQVEALPSKPIKPEKP